MHRMFAASAATVTRPPLVIHWDMDGVLVDSERLHREKLIKVAAKYGVTLRQGHFNKPQTFSVPDGQGGMKQTTMPMHGAGDKNFYYWLLAQKPALKDRLTQQAWLQELRDYYLAHVHKKVRPRGSIILQTRLLELYCRLRGILLVHGIVTSGIREQVEANRKVLGNKIHFSFVVTADDITKTKPDPEAYLAGLRKATELPELAGKDFVSVAVEDSKPGVMAAQSADIPCVHWRYPGSPAADKIDHHLVIPARGPLAVLRGIINLYRT